MASTLDSSSQRSCMQQVVRSVAAHTDTDPLALPPLYETIDADALDAVVDGMRSGAVEFRYVGTLVTVSSDGTVEVRAVPSDDAGRTESAADD